MGEPLFNGATVYAREETKSWSAPLLAIRPHRNQFTDVALPPERLIAVVAVPHDESAYWSVEFRGEFSRTGDPPVKVVGPMADRDAEGLCRALVAHYGLPRMPIEISPQHLASVTRDTYVTVIGRYHEGHCEGPNFEGVRLHAGTKLDQGRSYRVTGFIRPRTPPGAEPNVGYNGAELTALAIQPAA